MKTLKTIGMLACFIAAFGVFFVNAPKESLFDKQPLLPLGLFFLLATPGAVLFASLIDTAPKSSNKALPAPAAPVTPVAPVAVARPIPLPPSVAPATPVAVVPPVDKPAEVAPAPAAVAGSAEVQELRQALEARAKEAVDFKNAIEKKNREIETLRAGQNRSDLKEVNEAIAGLLQSVEFFKQRLAAQKDTLENLLPQVEEAIGDVFERAKLLKGLPEVGQRLADQPVDSCTIFNRVPAPTPELKGQIVEVRNSWVGFKVDQRLVIVSPSRIAVYV